ncbi:MAG TPA: ROK family protein [Bryobacteraceae bacterium]|nr:ROK family protein [Bryobacteraceae bacterium]
MKRVLGIDIGGRTTKLALVSPNGATEGITSIETSADSFLERVFAAAASLGPFEGVGISLAGFVNDERTAMFYNPNIAWLQGCPLTSAFEERFRLPVALDADSNAAALAEYRVGVGRGSKRFLSLVIGTGVGGGMVIDGEIARVAHGGLGDIGHVIVEPFGRECGSGCRGCAEATISAPAIEARAGGISVRELLARAEARDRATTEIFTEAGRLLGVAIASQAVILFPDVVSIAGGVAEAGDLLLAPAREAFHALVGPFYRDGVVIAKAALGWQAPLVGAALPLFD